MKVYTIYLNGDKGWTSENINGYYNEVLNAKECDGEDAFIPNEYDFNNQLKALNINDSYTVYFGSNPTTIQVKCEEMTEEEFNNLGEFSGW